MPNSKDAVLLQHCKELATKDRSYDAFVLLETLSLSDDSLTTVRGLLVELLTELERWGINPAGELRGITKASLDLEMPLTVKVLKALKETVAKADSIRQAKFCFGRYHSWITQAKRRSFEDVIDVFPPLAPTLLSLGNVGVQELFDAADGITNQKARQRMLQCVAEYGPTGSAQIVSAVRDIGVHACQFERVDLMEKLVKSLPPRKLMVSRDGQKLFPALAELSEVVRQLGKSNWESAVTIVHLLDAPNSAARYCVSRDLTRILPTIKEDLVAQYLADFNALVESFGLGAPSYACQELASSYRKGDKGAARFVDLASSAAKRYGRTAGWAFLQTKTASARKARTADE